MWVKGNALIVAGVQGTQPKVSPPPFCPAFGAPPKAGIPLQIKQRTRHIYMLALFVTKEEFGIGLFDIKSAAASFVKKGR